MNVAFFASPQFRSDVRNDNIPTPVNPEKIILVPAHENCLIWGNFYEEQIQYAVSVLSELFPDLVYSLEEAGDTAMYWLYIPPYPNKELANREINKLRNLGIVSFRVKDDNQWENAISLGMFYDQNDALKQLREVEKKGITVAKIDNRTVLLKKIVIRESTQIIKDSMRKLAEQFEDTHLHSDQCER
ncbi:SPOR domain-containing protein [Nitrosomonas sp.]|uniref:SPOR domain-containing protein n=1 Tax=Nitrosomonas sp. TaxID=42353 RepID=UPI0025EE415B|nr:SPOR domain-containing protein [Nitrosomonas sp.]